MQVDVDLKDFSYKVFIDELSQLKFNQNVAIITNQTVSGLWLKDLLSLIEAKNLNIISIPDGENYKNFDTLNFILEQLFVAKFDRKSTLIAFGGGVVSDITGFAASIFQRGIDFINIPTTLLSQIDASVGGKTGINNKFGKNLIGSFHQPKAVYCESKFLKTLPYREFVAGVAEGIKMAIMFDKNLFKFLEKSDLKTQNEISKLIKKCVEIKAKVVSLDERESNIRVVLNYGHTFGHVIENNTNYLKFLHGEAVSIGMNMANHLAFRLNLISKDELVSIEKLLIKFNLPTRYKIKDIEKFYDKFFLDKKSSNKKIKFILPNGIGKYIVKDDISKDIVLEVLREFQ
ncbi:3-dehydroquinate synthase [Campylobacter sp. FMV-PI01]|uniref:3-dehydroquinate synthase n=1 Tax=Campylobacter portucalensis TaxID=2608384 RepID=A0A6L5WJ78_9BACT|nr:3-dehydroquinate synthase [Campylobacter portucalensis]MSN96307.1 3-dehydroquinate synthase [Campylobacter portucalensis]